MTLLYVCVDFSIVVTELIVISELSFIGAIMHSYIFRVCVLVCSEGGMLKG